MLNALDAFLSWLEPRRELGILVGTVLTGLPSMLTLMLFGGKAGQALFFGLGSFTTMGMFLMLFSGRLLHIRVPEQPRIMVLLLTGLTVVVLSLIGYLVAPYWPY